MAKRGGTEGDPQGGKGAGVPNFRSARGGAGQLPVERGSVGRAKGGEPLMGGAQPVSRFMVTTMVKPRTLIGGVTSNFHHPRFQFGRKPVLQINGLLGLVSVFGRFLGYQIVPNFTIFYQERAANALEEADKGQLTGVFHDRFY